MYRAAGNGGKGHGDLLSEKRQPKFSGKQQLTFTKKKKRGALTGHGAKGAKTTSLPGKEKTKKGSDGRRKRTSGEGPVDTEDEKD